LLLVLLALSMSRHPTMSLHRQRLLRPLHKTSQEKETRQRFAIGYPPRLTLKSNLHRLMMSLHGFPFPTMQQRRTIQEKETMQHCSRNYRQH
jgi:hypothetical protein